MRHVLWPVVCKCTVSIAKRCHRGKPAVYFVMCALSDQQIAYSTRPIADASGVNFIQVISVTAMFACVLTFPDSAVCCLKDVSARCRSVYPVLVATDVACFVLSVVDLIYRLTYCLLMYSYSIDHLSVTCRIGLRLLRT